MADRRACPGCESHTSGTFRAWYQGTDCPHCGLTHAAAQAYFDAEESGASTEICKRLMTAETRALQAEHRVKEATRVLADLQRALKSDYTVPF